jgi:hypothetical protein
MLFHPTVCALGEGYKDTLMMKNSDISIEILHKNTSVFYNENNENT